jgi:hypothetical protein
MFALEQDLRGPLDAGLLSPGPERLSSRDSQPLSGDDDVVESDRR